MIEVLGDHVSQGAGVDGYEGVRDEAQVAALGFAEEGGDDGGGPNACFG